MQMPVDHRMRIVPVVIVALLARIAGAQVVDTTNHVSGAVISGVVRDSIARAPLAGAIVQLVAAGNPARFGVTTISDTLGRFTLKDVPKGRYTIGFFHPMLDSLGIEPPLRELNVAGAEPVRADIGLPSPARLRAAICGGQPSPNSGGVVVGTVRDARDGAPAAGVTVTGEWLELAIRGGKVDRSSPRLVSTTWDSGWFAMCNVPTGRTIFLVASRGADSTDVIEVQVPQNGFVRRELYLAPARIVVMGDTIQSDGDVVSRPHVVHLGDGRLTGWVVSALEEKPVKGALVRIGDGPETRANERGEWTLENAPGGTRMLEVRALGYYPERRRVDVVTGGPPVSVALSTLEAVLDTVKVTGRRMSDDSGFDDRLRSGVGHYVTPKDIERQHPLAVSELFRAMPGINLQYGAGRLGKRIVMRGAFGPCDPSIYINGLPMTSRTARGGAITITAEDIDAWMTPPDVTGIEVYAGDSAPVEYQQGMSGCGSILIWMKLRH